MFLIDGYGVCETYLNSIDINVFDFNDKLIFFSSFNVSRDSKKKRFSAS